MKKIKWMSTKLPISFKKLSNLMVDNQYSERSGEGFILAQRTSTFVEGRFINKRILVEELETPFGKSEEIERVIYNTVRFSLGTNGILQLNTPPREIRPFISSLHKLCGLGLVIEEFKADPIRWAKELEKQVGKIKIYKIECSGINLSNLAIAKVAVSGEQDIRKALKQFLGDNKFTADLVKFSINLRDSDCKIELSRRGQAKLLGVASISCADPLQDILMEIAH